MAGAACAGADLSAKRALLRRLGWACNGGLDRRGWDAWASGIGSGVHGGVRGEFLGRFLGAVHVTGRERFLRASLTAVCVPTTPAAWPPLLAGVTMPHDGRTSGPQGPEQCATGADLASASHEWSWAHLVQDEQVPGVHAKRP